MILFLVITFFISPVKVNGANFPESKFVDRFASANTPDTNRGNDDGNDDQSALRAGPGGPPGGSVTPVGDAAGLLCCLGVVYGWYLLGQRKQKYESK
jgi:hypothetical protein